MRLWFVLAAILLSVLLAGCYEGDPMLALDCKKIKATADRDMCYYNQSLAKTMALSCEDISAEDLRVKCVDTIAVNLADYYTCTRHSKMYQRDACEAKVSEVRKKARTATTNATGGA
jgi:hypothetical protein